jgi:hypothetical protein
MKEEDWGKEEKKITFRQVTGTTGNRNFAVRLPELRRRRRRGIEGNGKEKEEKRER